MHSGDKDFGDPGVKTVCRCMECARKREERRKKKPLGVIDKMIIGDANAQKTLRQLKVDILQILIDYDEDESIVGKLILDKLDEYHHETY